MPNHTVPAAATGLPVSGPLGRIPAGARATVVPADRRGFLKVLAGAAALGATAAASSPTEAGEELSADAALLALREPLLAAWHAEIEACARFKGIDSREANEFVEAAFARSAAIAGHIAELKATTLAGLGVQALALSWTHCGEPIPPEEISEQCTTDIVLLSSIAMTLIDMQDGLPGSTNV